MPTSGLLPILQFIVAIAVLIILHELGHFLMSKVFGVEVEEFGIGFPPRIVKLFEAGGTEFTLNWIPLGGFVRPKGENNPDIHGGLAAANPFIRIAVFLMGPIMNILAAIIIYGIVFSRIGIDITKVSIIATTEDSPAAVADIQPGDIVEQINGNPIRSTGAMRNEIYANLGQEIYIDLTRDGEPFSATVVPREDPPEGEGAIGVVMGNPRGEITPLKAVYIGGIAVYEQARTLLQLPGMLMRGDVSPEESRLVGYKGMYDIYTNQLEADASGDMPSGVNTLSFFATISVSLGLLNLLPVPALDGGRIMFALPEIIIGHRIPPKYENAINLIGLALLLILMIYINAQDFINPVQLP